MKIAYFTESLLPHVDGVSRTLAQLFSTLEERGMDFRVFSPFSPGDEVAWAGRVRAMRYVRFPLYPDYRISLPIGHGIARQLDEYRPEIIHVVSPTPMARWAIRYAKSRGVPVVASFHTHFVSYLRYYGFPSLERFGWWALRRFYRTCARIYVPSRNMMRELESHGIGQLQLWSRGIDAERFGPRFRDEALRARLGADARRPIVLLVSRLVKEKDLADLVEMDELLRARGARYRLVLVGEGPMRAELEAALTGAHFAGHQSGEALARWYASADLFVFPSTTETFGNVVLEALASGLPAVVVDRGGPPDQIAPGANGLIVRANHPASLADGVQHLLDNPRERERMGHAAAEGARHRSWSAINGELLESYAEVVRLHPRTGS